jgi:hypothetical protein
MRRQRITPRESGIAQAGRGASSVATNMAGRGTDIFFVGWLLKTMSRIKTRSFPFGGRSYLKEKPENCHLLHED